MGDSIGGIPGFGGAAHYTISARWFLVSDRNEGILQVTVELEPTWHIYSVTQPDKGPTRTEIHVDWPKGMAEIGPAGEFLALQKPHVYEVDYFPVPIEEHSERVDWVILFSLPASLDTNGLTITGSIDGQVCQDGGSCIMLDASKTTFQATFAGPADTELVSLVSAPQSAAPSLESTSPYKTTGPGEQSSFLYFIGMGLLGGLILNLMPCVLPVIGLKIMSFIQQGGESRWHIFLMNLVYSLGLLSVFWLLALLAWRLNFGWGEQFTDNWFKVTMTGLVFVMGLSFLDVWEMPIPGFAGSTNVNRLAAREDLAGAFVKGLLTTVLATPCSAPLLGPVFGFAVQQPPAMIFALFTSIGVGMALPYLLIGLFPGLISFLPKPGAWMDHLKHVMAFLMLGTTIYLINTINEEYTIATLTLLLGLGFACWLYGAVPATAERGRKLWIRTGAVASAVLIGLIGFLFFGPQPERIQWEPFSFTALEEAQKEGKTVLIEFTADWCPNCKYNYYTAINTDAVAEAIRRDDIVPLLADWTDHSPEIKKMVNQLGKASIPLLAIFPGDRPNEPIVLPDIITKGQLLEAITQAQPRSAAESAPAAPLAPAGRQVSSSP